jgi:hypothetical protein
MKKSDALLKRLRKVRQALKVDWHKQNHVTPMFSRGATGDERSYPGRRRSPSKAWNA